MNESITVNGVTVQINYLDAHYLKEKGYSDNYSTCNRATVEAKERLEALKTA